MSWFGLVHIVFGACVLPGSLSLDGVLKDIADPFGPHDVVGNIDVGAWAAVVHVERLHLSGSHRGGRGRFPASLLQDCNRPVAGTHRHCVANVADVTGRGVNGGDCIQCDRSLPVRGRLPGCVWAFVAIRDRQVQSVATAPFMMRPC